MADEDDIQAFLLTPLVRWAGSLLPGGEEVSWPLLARGVGLTHLLEGLDAHFQIEVDPDPGDVVSRARNMTTLLNSLRQFYKEVLGQLIMIPLPSARDLALIPPTSSSLEQMTTLLLLILGAAVQSDQKQEVIITIKNLPLETQHGIVDRIRAVTDNPGMVWTRELSDPATLGDEQRDEMYGLLLEHTTRLVNERDKLSEELALSRIELDTRLPPLPEDGGADTPVVTTASNHALVEVAESKAKLRKLRQQLEEKTEQLAECREELEKLQDVTGKLKAENLELCQDARAAKAYRDELDVVRERADKVDKLEAEVQRYRDKMNDIDFFKSRVEELREDNRILVETKEMLEEQLASSRKRCEAVLGLENELIKSRGETERLQHERDQDRTKIKELLDENAALAFRHKNSMSESQSLLAEMEAMKGKQGSKELNLLSEQLGKDAVTRVHRLELENKHLKQELETAKTQLAKKEMDTQKELENESKRANLMVSRLEEQAKRDSAFILVAEQEAAAAKQELMTLQTTVDTLNEQFNLLQIEKETEVDALVKQVNALTARASTSQSQQLSSLQEENRKLVSERTVLQTQVSKFGHEKERAAKTIQQLKEKMVALEQAETIRTKLERENSHLAAELENYSRLQGEYDSAVEQISSITARLKEQTERLDEIQTENMKLKVENQKLSRRMETIRTDNQTILDLEGDKETLKQTVAQLKATVEGLQSSQVKQDELEVKCMTFANENTKLQRQMETLTRKMEEVAKENTEMETENKKMQKTIETLKVTVRRVNQLESESLELEGRTHKVERENRSLTRELDRLRQAIEVKDLSLDNSSARLNQIERELEKARQELESARSAEQRVQELEAATADLASQAMADKRALLDLREELVREKMAGEQLTANLEQANSKLQNMQEIASQLEESKAVSSSKAASTSSSTNTSVLTGEEKVHILQAERDELSSEVARLRVAAVGSSDKEAVLTQHVQSLQEEVVAERKEKACLQVENRTLQSQSSSLLAQINSLQADYSRLETDLSRAAAKEKEAREETGEVLADQTRLQRLHEQLQQDYDTLRQEREDLKTSERGLRLEIAKLREKISGLNQGQEDILRAKEAIDMERETLNMDKKSLANLRSEHSRLKDDFRSLFTANERMKSEYCNLQTDYKALKTEFNQLKLKKTELSGNLADAKEQITLLDVENTKVTNRCEVLHQLNLSLEEDRKSLMSQVSLLLYQYHDLLTQTLDDKEHYHEEERGYTDKVNNLRRQKEKLEEKIMEQYKKMDNSTPKKKGLGLNIVKKMKKAGSSMFLASPSAPGGAGRGRAREREDLDSSSLGSGGNDSLDSGGRSPADTMLGSELHLGDKLLFRRSLPASMMGIGLEDMESEGHNADNESLASYLSGALGGGFTDNDHIPTRDTGPMRDLYTNEPESGDGGGSSGLLLTPGGSSGLLLTPASLRKVSEPGQPRSISRVYLSSGEEPPLVVGGGGGRWRSGGKEGEEPRLTAWRRTGDQDASLMLPPQLPARRAPTPPPNRPPKPRGGGGGGSASPTEEEGAAGSSSKGSGEPDSNSESSVWYEYGCV